MIFFIVRRIAEAFLVMGVVALISFSLFRFVGDPINNMVGQDTSQAEREVLRTQLGLNDAIVTQFARFVADASHGDFGMSYRQARPVAELIGERLPATLELSVVASVIALVLGMVLGVYTGLHRKGFLSRLVMAGSLIGISLPTFLIGIFLILIFSVWLGWLPSFGRGDVVRIGGWSTGLLTVSGWKAVLMPAVTLGLFQMTLIMRLVRSELMEILRTDYIKFARARGLPDRSIHFGHALRNTMIPVITITGLQLGSIIAFAIITESVFQWPGLGLLFLQSVQFADIPVMAAYLLLVAFLFVLINLLVDVLYYLVDPRLRGQLGGTHAKT
ncbi:ABC transporter permease [Azospirillum sp. CT11-132]|uniref:ABC transporter permease n=1 Tax=Azospirillum sp. CT11-132 TaxID=3396317 RepID=UPI0039A6D7E4